MKCRVLVNRGMDEGLNSLASSQVALIMLFGFGGSGFRQQNFSLEPASLDAHACRDGMPFLGGKTERAREEGPAKAPDRTHLHKPQFHPESYMKEMQSHSALRQQT